MKNKLPTACPKPKPKPSPAKRFSSIREKTYAERLVASQSLRSTTPPKKKARTKKEKERIYGPEEYANWIHRQPCIVANTQRSRPCQGNIEQAHTQTGGMGRKADFIHSVPLCKAHHIDLHTVGRTSFETYHNVSLQDAASRIGLKWQAFQSEKNAEVG